MSSQYYFPPYNEAIAWSKFDAIYGVNPTGAGTYFYATQNVPAGQYSPSGTYSFNISAYSRVDDITTLTYSHTGGLPIAAGSIIKVAAVSANTSVEFTGMALYGGSGTLSYVNPGWTQAQSCGGTISCLNPGWTTGFMFQPTYTSKVNTQNNAIIAQLGDGYSQRQPNGLNTFAQTWTLVYQSRSAREMRAITNYVEDRGGASAFELLIPDQFLTNQPNAKFIAPTVEVTPVSFGLYDISVAVTRVFDL